LTEPEIARLCDPQSNGPVSDQEVEELKNRFFTETRRMAAGDR
jgi:hypothetical protein